MENTTYLSKKDQFEFRCEKCDYKCSCKRDWSKHLLTKKHNKTNATKKFHICECGKKYKHRASLYNHKKKCSYDKPVVENEETEQVVTTESINHNLILNVLDENKELLKILIQQQEELSKQNEQIISGLILM